MMAARAVASELDASQQEVKAGRRAALLSLLTPDGDTHSRGWPPLT